jgi:hypothetical protein
MKEVLDGQIDDDLEDDCPLCQQMKGQPEFFCEFDLKPVA